VIRETTRVCRAYGCCEHERVGEFSIAREKESEKRNQFRPTLREGEREREKVCEFGVRERIDLFFFSHSFSSLLTWQCLLVAIEEQEEEENVFSLLLLCLLGELDFDFDGE
jgi:hypothetical protein